MPTAVARLTDVSESLRLVVAVMVFEACIALGAVVPGQLQQTLTVGGGIDAIRRGLRNALVTWVAEKVKVEFCVFVLARS